MITAEDVRGIAIFECLDAAVRDRVLSEGAEVYLHAGEYLIREGEQASFFVMLEGRLQVHKDVGGRSVTGQSYGRGVFLGEVPLLLGTPSFASMVAIEGSRLLRLDHRHLRMMIDDSSECSGIILKTMAERVSMIQEKLLELPSTRVTVVGSQYDTDVRDIRTFLSMNRIPYAWINRETHPDQVPTCALPHVDGPRIVIDGDRCMGAKPTVRKVAFELGFDVAPRASDYDVTVIGGGPAGLAAAVYGASEGLSTLLIERSAVGGQAGTSSRIENYLGFPAGISGNDLAQRARAQAEKFGAHMVVTRNVERVEAIEGGYCVQLDGGERVSSRVVVLATGVDWRTLDAEGIDRLQGRGVLYGAARTEAGSVVGKDIFIVGGGNSAGQAAMFFSSYARSVTMLVRSEKLSFSMSRYLEEQIRSRCNVAVETWTTVKRVEGEDHLESIVTVREGDPPQTRPADALFLMIGADAQTAWLPAELQRDERGYICTGRDVSDLPDWKGTRQPFLLETSLPGFFCAGDVRHDSIKRVASGVGEGSMAIAFIHQYLALEQRQQAALLA